MLWNEYSFSSAYSCPQGTTPRREQSRQRPRKHSFEDVVKQYVCLFMVGLRRQVHTSSMQTKLLAAIQKAIRRLGCHYEKVEVLVERSQNDELRTLDRGSRHVDLDLTEYVTLHIAQHSSTREALTHVDTSREAMEKDDVVWT